MPESRLEIRSTFLLHTDAKATFWDGSIPPALKE